jgi:diaminohydroxyphosphoribosylaminopyrimidine deaminase/5-amino-6-(5-phosphoribosylamino)uracil reductase
MRIAIGLARRGHGNVSPNPSVGCVIVKDDCIVGRGWTQPGGRPHAETEALARARGAAAGATAYVTLEPCAHHGKTPPCARALIEAGIARAVIGVEDPDPRVNGGGIRMLRDAGIEVTTGLCAAEAKDAAAGFLMRVVAGRPLVTVKAATTLDGKIATRTGDSHWITGETARAMGHGLRARHDAILVGAGTARADNPSLTCRLPGLEERSPVRVVVGGRTPLSAESTLLRTADVVPTWIVLPDDADPEWRRSVEGTGAELMSVRGNGAGGADPAAILSALGDRGITRLLVEGGGRIVGSLMAGGLVDRTVWFRAPMLIGGDGLSAVDGFGLDALDGAPRFVKVSHRRAGPDSVEVYARSD